MDDLISRKWLMECIDEGWIKFDTEKDTNRYIHLVRDIAPSAQPERKTDGDLISRQAAIEEIRTYITKPNISDDESEIKGYNDGFELAISVLSVLPSAQSEIILCKDCKYVGSDATCCLVCNRAGMGLKPYHVYRDDYCSYAERKTNWMT